MEKSGKTNVTVSTEIDLSPEKVWELWTSPAHITHWNFASDDWQCPAAENDLKPGGKFNWHMEAKDGSAGFDFSGIYLEIVPNELIRYKMDDGRLVQIEFKSQESGVKIIETFEAENQNSIELQRQGWQAILDNFKKYSLLTN
ncbi:polyketide cyclase [Gramella sp. MT6]|uniref:SRPBCC family protein n=1 Tax=Gramella sp. MT6 TaxID=2705471 RepID=UPI001C603F14|nr:SRPBCC family protein [Gramella sp. MT6]QYA24498.1 polyketide cyclase [Gramella sp. MT6]